MMNNIDLIVEYLKDNKLVLATAESCTAGEIMATLSKHGDCGDCLFIGYVVYHPKAKIRELGVKKSTIKKYSLTSEEVAKEMVEGVFQHTEINTGIATTGIIGPDSMDGIPPGTVCFAWRFNNKHDFSLFSETKVFKGSPAKVLKSASIYALSRLPHYHQLMLKESK